MWLQNWINDYHSEQKITKVSEVSPLMKQMGLHNLPTEIKAVQI